MRVPENRTEHLGGFTVVPFARPGQLSGPGVDPYMQGLIAAELRAMYDELVQQPLPERFLELLGQFDQDRTCRR